MAAKLSRPHCLNISKPSTPQSVEQSQKPAVSVRRSVFADGIVCLEDGKKFQSLKRHLMSAHGLTPEQYRQKWKLAPDYPMVAEAYSERRSLLAKETGLGKGGRKRRAR
jgi:predicted transcriptional regulator